MRADSVFSRKKLEAAAPAVTLRFKLRKHAKILHLDKRNFDTMTSDKY
jgi:hypothetical protein